MQLEGAALSDMSGVVIAKRKDSAVLFIEGLLDMQGFRQSEG